jgi:hypothetical protein
VKRRLGALLILSCVAFCAASEKGKIVAVWDASETGATAGSNDPVNSKNGPATILLPGMVTRCAVTVRLQGMEYTGIFYEDKHFKRTDLVEGQMIDARVQGSKLILRRPSDGKDMKGKIVDRTTAQKD